MVSDNYSYKVIQEEQGQLAQQLKGMLQHNTHSSELTLTNISIDIESIKV